MAGQLKEVRNRISSVQSMQQITKAMKMVSAAKFRRAQDSILQMRPYAQKLQEMLSNIVSNSEGGASLPLAEERPVEKVLIVVVTSDRGLAGAFNTNIIKLTKATIQEKYAEQYTKGNVHIMGIGKKGYEHFAKNGYKTDSTYRDIFHDLRFENVEQASRAIMQMFLDKQYDVVEIVYSRFKNAVTQLFTVERFLPIPKSEKAAGGSKADFIFDPNKDELVAELMPRILNTQLYKVILDSNASEHGARMTSMDKASDNANEILRNLKLSYNRARQAAITTELTEIVSGAAALQG
ncbi:MAG: ATP synthase F1 subunit gamma [Niabella sp.]